jgi:adenosylhomocysteine nucleosidase
MTADPYTCETVVLISADEEWKVVKETIPLPGVEVSPFGEWSLHKLDLRGSEITTIFFQTGCGKIPAAASTQFVIDKWRPRLVINLGTCGGFEGRVKKGDILLVGRTIVYDIMERSGAHDEQIAKYVTDLDLSWLEKPYPLNAKVVTMASADQDLDPKKMVFLHEKYGAVAADWESGAIAYVASKKNRLRCLILRGVSDLVRSSGGEIYQDPDKFREGVMETITVLLHALTEWIELANLKIKSTI